VLYHLARSFLFSLDPEIAHELTLSNLDRAYALGVTRLFSRRIAPLPVRVMGLDFQNPVGLAAGMDKNGAHIDALGSFGFGFIEAGTVTPKAQPGNPKPRIFRLVPAEGLINRLGFNNDGVDRFVENVRGQTAFRRRGGIVGLNIGKNASTPIDRALDDYVACLRRVYEIADYIAVNISSPNTKDLRALQGRRELKALLGGLADERKRLEDEHGRRVPLAVKIAPDLDDDEIPPIADVLVACGVDGVIATNTTVARDAVKGLEHADESGDCPAARWRPLDPGRRTAGTPSEGLCRSSASAGSCTAAMPSRRSRPAHRWCRSTRASSIRGRTSSATAWKRSASSNRTPAAGRGAVIAPLSSAAVSLRCAALSQPGQTPGRARDLRVSRRKFGLTRATAVSCAPRTST
jgi:dihydroorotate dehydrogenase